MQLSVSDYVVVMTVSALVPLGFAVWRRYDGDVRGAPPGWRGLPRPRRRAIRRAVLRGEAVDGTPAELLIAGGLATALRRRLDPARVVLPVLAFALFAGYFVLLAVRHNQPAWLIFTAFYAALAPFQIFQWRRSMRRLDRAYVANYAALDAATTGA